tara:strand:- start:1099 stop:1428 length:330 start_codon:yes stop_codon:yes gene_type:complete
MATTFKNKNIVQVGTVPVEVLETTAAQRATIVGLSLTNLTDSFVYVTVLVDDDTSVQGHFMKDVLLPANTSLRAVNGGEKLILAPSNKLSVKSSVSDSVDVLLSYVEIT